MDAGSAAATAGLHVAPRAAPARSAAAGAAPAAATSARSRAEARTERAGWHATAPASQPAAVAAHAGVALSAAAAPADGRRSASPPGAAAGSASVDVQDARTPCVHACNKHGRKRMCMFHASWLPDHSARTVRTAGSAHASCCALPSLLQLFGSASQPLLCICTPPSGLYGVCWNHLQVAPTLAEPPGPSAPAAARARRTPATTVIVQVRTSPCSCTCRIHAWAATEAKHACLSLHSLLSCRSIGQARPFTCLRSGAC